MNWQLILQAIIDFLKVFTPPRKPSIPAPQPIPTAPHISKISPWALAIQHQEGGKPQDRNTRNRNPGNLKFTPYTKSLGAINHDAGNFCIFNTYTDGFKALCQFLTDAADGHLVNYRPEMTLDKFTTVYAVPPNKNYVNGVAKTLAVAVTTPIKDLL